MFTVSTISRRLLCGAGALLATLALTVSPGLAIPTLQLYIEGSTYDLVDESWTFVGDEFTLLVIGDVGSYGTIFDVKLTVAFPVRLDPDNVHITGTTATEVPDPTPTADPTLIANPSSALSSSEPCGDNSTVLTLPCKGDGTPLAKHGEYGPVQWIEFSLGDFTATDSPIGDFIFSFPTSFPSTGQVNAYFVQLNAGFGDPFPAGTEVHFDAFDHIVQNNGKTTVVFAPFSHDALDRPDGRVPVPPPLLLLGSGLIGWFVFGRRRRD